MILDILKQEIESDIHNLKEAQKLPESKRTQQYIKRMNKSIDELIRFIGRTAELQDTNKYLRLNTDAYERGEIWLKIQGVVL